MCPIKVELPKLLLEIICKINKALTPIAYLIILIITVWATLSLTLINKF